MRVLIIEDEVKIASAIKRGLEQEKFVVDMVHDSDSGLSYATGDDYDLIILDRMLPGTYEGLELLSEFRRQDINVSVLILTAKDKTTDKIEGLNIGADDYLVKPFAFDELLARIRALLRRPRRGLDTNLKYNDISLDLETFTAIRAGRKIKLTAKEFALLEYMMRNPDRVLNKDAITAHVWDADADILPNTVEVYMGYLRNKIDRPFKTKLIHTRRGFGYMFGVKK